jgi:hypothetical protein
MFFFLRDARDGLSTMVDMVTSSPAYLYGILADMKERHVSIMPPKFAITFSWGDPVAGPPVFKGIQLNTQIFWQIILYMQQRIYKSVY